MKWLLLTYLFAASPKTFFELSANDIHGKKIHFSQYRGKVVLVVNTASQPDFIPQLKELEEVYRKYAGRGFVVLMFPTTDFKQDIKDYHLTFPVFDKNPVRGLDKQPVYSFLIEQKPGMLFHEVRWNYEKFLVNRQGRVIERWNSMTSPSAKTIVGDIEKALSDPL
jgi:glutathione peroxidase